MANAKAVEPATVWELVYDAEKFEFVSAVRLLRTIC